jgi:UPF0755 protein
VSRAPRPLPSLGGLSRQRRLAVMLISAAATLAGVFLLALIWAAWSYQGPGPKAPRGEVTNVILRKGAGVTEIASTLERAHVVGSASIFVAASQVTGAGRHLKAGEYEFPSRTPMAKVLSAIRDGKIVRHQVTVPEGMTSQAVVDELTNIPILTGAVATPPEGSILPETYQYSRGEDRSAVLARMISARDALVTLLWSKRQDGLPFTTPDEAVTLASIVEKETGLPSERPRVAAVFINRLRAGQRLQSDPTIIYGITGGKPLGRGIRASELIANTPYNTYVIPGLPPGPIANPGRASLAAVLDPPKTTELYFVADGTGGHVFASTYEQHAKNVARWRAVERAKGHGDALTPDPAAQPAKPGTAPLSGTATITVER